MKTRLRTFFEPLWELFYPGRLSCLLCGEEALLNDEGLCAVCAPKLSLAARYHTLSNVEAASAFAFEGDIRQLIHRFKYGNARYLARFFAKGMSRVLPADLRFDVIMPVPLHPRRKRERGYNQSLLLARELSIWLRLPVDARTLRRIRHTPTQTHLDAVARAENLRGAFTSDTITKRVLLVDDVLTTGHTLMFCAQSLYDAGAVFVYALTASS